WLDDGRDRSGTRGVDQDGIARLAGGESLAEKGDRGGDLTTRGLSADYRFRSRLARLTIAAGDELMDRWQQSEALFFEALERAGAERAAFLKAECGEDIDLRREIEAMVAAHEDATPFAIEQRFLTESADEPDPYRTPGTRVGVYRLIEV